MTRTATTRHTAAALSAMSRDAFTETLAGVFEHSPWVAEGAWSARPFHDLDQLHGALVAVVRHAGRERRLALIRAHPELAGKAAASGAMTRDSTLEQASAGLDRCAPEELAALRQGNRAYLDRFGFPFVMAVKGRTRTAILQALAQRLDNSPQAEFDRCLDEIAKIARLRLADLVAP